MGVKYYDYYEMLGLSRDASEKDIKRAYRKLARQYHPDVNRAPDAEKKFKEVTEAYDVLSDPAKRKRYDQLGANWKAGQDFTPPPGWGSGNVQYEFHGGGEPFAGGEFGDFSDFFSSLFGGMAGGPARSAFRSGAAWRSHGQDHEAQIEISLDEAFHGVHKNIAVQTTDVDAGGHLTQKTKNISVTIPPGTGDNSRIRLAEQGGQGVGGGRPGHLYLRVRITPHERFQLQGRDLLLPLPVTPAQAALGARVTIQTLDKKMGITLPAGSSGNTQLRLRGLGLPAHGKKPAGDLLLRIRIVVPKSLTPRQRALYEELLALESPV